MSHAALPEPGPYSPVTLAQRLVLLGPKVIGGIPDIAVGFAGPHRVSAPARVAAQIRLARVLGCPVCAGLFPRLAGKVGLSEDQVARVREGELAGLAPDVAGAVAWVEEVLVREGQEPEVIPQPATHLSPEQRDHLLAMARLELIVHHTGLMLLPKALVRRAAGRG